MRDTVVIQVFGVLFGLLVGTSCWGLASNHCGNLEGDTTCAERGHGAFCDACSPEADGCTDLLPSSTCHFPGAGGSTTGLGEESSTGGAVPTTSVPDVDSTGTSTTATTAPGGCERDNECDDPTPFCNSDSGECVSCSSMDEPNAACAAVDPTMPVCDEGRGACVQCTNEQPGECDAQLLLCDSGLGTCTACTEHAQCPSGACDIFIGVCFDSSTVVAVGGNGQAATIGEGLDMLEPLWPDMIGQRRGVILLGEGEYDERLNISLRDTDSIAFIGVTDVPPRWGYTGEGAQESPTLTVGNGTRAYLQEVTLTGNTGSLIGKGLQCNNSKVDIRRSRVVANAQGAVNAVGTCELRVTNSFLGTSVDDTDALLISGGAVDVEIVYSTLGAGDKDSRALRCSNDNFNVVLRNSLAMVVTNHNAISCQNATLASSAILAQHGNGLMSFFVNYVAGDFRFDSAAPPGVKVADWEPGDPITDIDGTPRFTADDECDYAGGDVPPLSSGACP